jgi:hypothetical protein
MLRVPRQKYEQAYRLTMDVWIVQCQQFGKDILHFRNAPISGGAPPSHLVFN